MNPLDSCWAKLQRADETIRAFNAESTAFLGDPKPYEVVREFQNDGLEYAFIVKSTACVPPRLSILAGEVIHQLRSSLDHLVTALVHFHGGAVTRQHTFPICTTVEKFEQARQRGDIKGISVSAENLIRAQQPYLGSTPEDNFLVALHDLDIQDKHRLPLTIAGSARMGKRITLGTDEELADRLGIKAGAYMVTGLSRPEQKKITKEGIKVIAITLAKAEPTFKADADLIIDVAFEKCGIVELLPVTTALTGMLGMTATLIDKFSAEFA